LGQVPGAESPPLTPIAARGSRGRHTSLYASGLAVDFIAQRSVNERKSGPSRKPERSLARWVRGVQCNDRRTDRNGNLLGRAPRFVNSVGFRRVEWDRRGLTAFVPRTFPHSGREPLGMVLFHTEP
jgi:hypothetical protein